MDNLCASTPSASDMETGRVLNMNKSDKVRNRTIQRFLVVLVGKESATIPNRKAAATSVLKKLLKNIQVQPEKVCFKLTLYM